LLFYFALILLRRDIHIRFRREREPDAMKAGLPEHDLRLRGRKMGSEQGDPVLET